MEMVVVVYEQTMEEDKPTTSGKANRVDQQKCILCRRATSESLQHPADFKLQDICCGYESFARNIELCQDLKCLPINIVVTTLDEEEGFAQIFRNRG